MSPPYVELNMRDIKRAGRGKGTKSTRSGKSHKSTKSFASFKSGTSKKSKTTMGDGMSVKSGN